MSDLCSNNSSTDFLNINIPDGDISSGFNLYSASEADSLFESLKTEIDWKQERISMFGQTHDVPRLTAWYGDPGKSYTYAGISVDPSPWNPILLETKKKVESV